MTAKEAVLKSLEEINTLTNYTTVLNHILSNKYYDFPNSAHAGNTVSATLGDFIRNGDARVKRVKQEGGTYSYYLTKIEDEIGIEIISSEQAAEVSRGTERYKTFNERDLHILLSSYLSNSKIYSKTIFHEHSVYNKDSNQTWTHPDMVGVQFLDLHTKASKDFLKIVNRADSFKLSSYEIKREINSDGELKKAFFQAVSNSSWANYAYLVAFEFSDALLIEMERLNKAFGVGVIELNSNPYKSKILFSPTYRDLDFRTIDKLCLINRDFENFIKHVESLLTAEEKYYKASEKELKEFSDNYLLEDSEFKAYCLDKNIPIDDIEEDRLG